MSNRKRKKKNSDKKIITVSQDRTTTESQNRDKTQSLSNSSQLSASLQPIVDPV